MPSTKKAKANRSNAKLSTGPQSAAGKARSSANALDHGVLSRHLLLPEEDQAEWSALLQRLLDELRPHGTLEQALVERIAVAIWRQRRVIRAETARIRKAQVPGAFEKIQLGAILGSDSKLIEVVLAGEKEELYRTLHAELTQALAAPLIDLEILRAEYPRIWLNLQSSAKASAGVEAYLAKSHQGSAVSYLHRLLETVKPAVAAYEYMQVQRDASSMPAAPELMARYQAAIDNDLYKAMRALRDAQRFRREVYENDATPIDEITDK